MLNIKHLAKCSILPIPTRLSTSSLLRGIPAVSKQPRIYQTPSTPHRQFSIMAPKSWADGPFKLIPTPLFTQGPDKPVDQYVTVASQMAIAHNTIIRALNRYSLPSPSPISHLRIFHRLTETSIYLQAPHVKPEDYKDFIGYSLCWYQMITNHHRGEEDRLFPQIEEKTEKGLMEVNVEQHRTSPSPSQP
jgi:hypothetical protein